MYGVHAHQFFFILSESRDCAKLQIVALKVCNHNTKDKMLNMWRSLVVEECQKVKHTSKK